mmetsp:Transcript_18404/g.59868  ORF Transcript_18404/g.59868 Transcript_18404/m.59868 type:complete len:365 (+) Transcript_18404:4694-5788(+)
MLARGRPARLPGLDRENALGPHVPALGLAEAPPAQAHARRAPGLRARGPQLLPAAEVGQEPRARVVLHDREEDEVGLLRRAPVRRVVRRRRRRPRRAPHRGPPQRPQPRGHPRRRRQAHARRPKRAAPARAAPLHARARVPRDERARARRRARRRGLQRPADAQVQGRRSSLLERWRGQLHDAGADGRLRRRGRLRRLPWSHRGDAFRDERVPLDRSRLRPAVRHLRRAPVAGENPRPLRGRRRELLREHRVVGRAAHARGVPLRREADAAVHRRARRAATPRTDRRLRQHVGQGRARPHPQRPRGPEGPRRPAQRRGLQPQRPAEGARGLRARGGHRPQRGRRVFAPHRLRRAQGGDRLVAAE